MTRVTTNYETCSFQMGPSCCRKWWTKLGGPFTSEGARLWFLKRGLTWLSSASAKHPATKLAEMCGTSVWMMFMWNKHCTTWTMNENIPATEVWGHYKAQRGILYFYAPPALNTLYLHCRPKTVWPAKIIAFRYKTASLKCDSLGVFYGTQPKRWTCLIETITLQLSSSI